MEKVCEIGPENLRKNVRVEELLSSRNVSCYFRRGKRLVMSTTKPDNLMQSF